MVLNSGRLMPRLSTRYCGIFWYFSNSRCQSDCDSGGEQPQPDLVQMPTGWGNGVHGSRCGCGGRRETSQARGAAQCGNIATARTQVLRSTAVPDYDLCRHGALISTATV